jgi:hypothetical protein
MPITRPLPGRTRPELALSNRAAPDGTRRLRDLTLLHVGDGLWRVVNRSGTVLGHIERTTDGVDERFAARRLLAATRTMVLGTFWNIDDATACFR